MAKIKPLVDKFVTDFAFEEIYCNTGKNYRHAWKYKVEPKKNYDPTQKGEAGIPGFFESVVENGIRVNIEVAVLSSDQIDQIEAETGVRYKARVIRGHRRYTAAKIAREQFNISKFDRLTCVAYVGLTSAEETALKFDQDGIEPLDEYELYRAIIDLVGTGKSQEAIAGLVGRNRNYVQDRIYIWSLPEYVRANFERKHTPLEDGTMPKKGKNYVHVTTKDVDEMHALLATDKANGIDSADPDSKVSEYWNNLVNKTKQPANGDGPNTKPLSTKTLNNLTGFIKGCEALELAHSVYSGEGGSIQDAADQYRALESQALTVPGLKSQVADLTEQVAGLTKLLDEKEGEILRLSNLVASLTPTNGVHEPVIVN